MQRACRGFCRRVFLGLLCCVGGDSRTACPPRAANLRALALEHERLANHLGDLGALGNDAGFAFGLTHFSRMKEDLLRINAATFGARYLFDFVQPGGVAADLPENTSRLLLDHYLVLEEGVSAMRAIYDNHAGLQDRFRDAGIWRRKWREAGRNRPGRDALRVFCSICAWITHGRPTAVWNRNWPPIPQAMLPRGCRSGSTRYLNLFVSAVCSLRIPFRADTAQIALSLRLAALDSDS